MSEKFDEGRQQRFAVKCQRDLKNSEHRSTERQSFWDSFCNKYSEVEEEDEVIDYDALDNMKDVVEIESGKFLSFYHEPF